jgi:hypothetical protein
MPDAAGVAVIVPQQPSMILMAAQGSIGDRFVVGDVRTPKRIQSKKSFSRSRSGTYVSVT